LRNPALAGLVDLLLAGSERILALPSPFLAFAALARAILLWVLIAGPLALTATAFNVVFLVALLLILRPLHRIHLPLLTIEI
jgi:predicted membrane chloride channel (bestrophin family)